MSASRSALLADLMAYADDRGLTKSDIAAELGISRAVLSNWIRRGEVSKDGIELVYKLGISFGGGVDVPPHRAALAPVGALSIPFLNVRGSMGDGALNSEHLDVIRGLQVSPEDLRKIVPYGAQRDLSFITGYGNSMEPTFSDGDILLVDNSVKTVEVDAIYVFTIGSDSGAPLFIKTLQRRRDGSLLMVSHNRQAYEPEPIPKGESITIHGRVILAWNAKRL